MDIHDKRNQNYLSKRIFSVLAVVFAQCLAFSSHIGAQVRESEQTILDRVNLVYQSGNFEKASEELENLIKVYPKSYGGYFLRGEISLLFWRNPDGCIADTKHALTLIPKNISGRERLYNNLGIAYQIKGENILALENFRAAISINPKFPPPYNGLGVILEKQGKRDEALVAFNKFIELDPLSPWAGLTGRADIYFSQDKLDLALIDLDLLIKGTPDVSSAYIRRGFIKAIKSSWEIAVNDFRAAFRIDRRPNRILGGVLTVSFGDIDNYLTRNPESSHGFAARGFLNFLRNREREAELDFKRAFHLKPELADILGDLISSVKEFR